MVNSTLIAQIIRRGSVPIILMILLLTMLSLVATHGPNEVQIEHFISARRHEVVAQSDLNTLIRYDLQAILPQFQLHPVVYHNAQYIVELHSDEVGILDDHSAEELVYISVSKSVRS